MLPVKKIVIVSEKKSFFVAGLSKKLQEIGVRGIFAAPDTISLGAADEDNDPIVYFTGDELYSNRGLRFVESLKTHCLSKGRLLILIGDDEEYRIVTDILPQTAITRRFPRVVKMDELIATVKGCMLGNYSPATRHHILIVDDDISYLRMLYGLLKDIYEITLIDTGRKAEEWLTRHKVDLILLDYEMPEMDGPEVFSRLKHHDFMKNIPVIFLTGKQDRKTVMRVLDLHPEDYILKSVDKKTLVRKLEIQFEKKQTITRKAEADFLAECQELLMGNGLSGSSPYENSFQGSSFSQNQASGNDFASAAFPNTAETEKTEGGFDGSGTQAESSGLVDVPMMDLEDLEKLLAELD
ncbi:MAG: response regulator [Lachnospiraceae bacterium]|nr:response regulator [Lachnospiraceae bacterium]